MRRLKLVALAALSVLLPAAAATSVSANDTHGSRTLSNEATYTVVFENITGGQYFTPPNFAAHASSTGIYRFGQPASPGVQAVAENGMVPVLAAEIKANIDDLDLGVSGVAGPAVPIGPGETRSFEFTTRERHLSLVSMIVCTNDGFAGLETRRLPSRDGQSKRYLLRGFDAGTEKNTELVKDIVPAPFCGDQSGTDQSNPDLAENGVIKRHRTLKQVGDLAESLDWRGRVASLTITRNDTPPTYDITVTNTAGGQYLTPPNFAVHASSFDAFQPGHPASPGIQAVAENGMVPVLAAEFAANVDDQGLGVSGVAGPAVPIGPGQSRSFEVTSKAPRLTIISMLVCTNDGFAGLDAKSLPKRSGQTKTYRVRGYDAGTEKNTELVKDIVPAPFCGDQSGTDQSNPDLAENGVIKTHRTLKQVGDLAESLDWRGRVMTVTITRR